MRRPSPKSTRRSRDSEAMNLFQRLELMPCSVGEEGVETVDDSLGQDAVSLEP